MEINALNNEVGVEIQGMPDGRIIITGMPAIRPEGTVRGKVMSTKRSIIIDRQVAIQLLEGLIKRDAENYDLDLMQGYSGVETECDVSFSTPRPGHFDKMNFDITFRVKEGDASDVEISETGLLELKEQEEDQLMAENETNTAFENPVSLGVPSDCVEESDGQEEREWQTFCRKLDYCIKVNFSEFLLAMVSAL